MTADVLVVGAGPAGSVAAMLLARAGTRVRVIDRARFPRDKLCGDTLNPGALARLERLGVGGAVLRQALPVSGMIVTGPGGARVVGEYPDHVRGAAITRRRLDTLLLDAAVRAGAEFEPDLGVQSPLVASDGRVRGVRVRGPAGERELQARLVIAADGRCSRLAFALGLTRYASRPRRWAFGTYYTDVDGLTAYGEMHIRPGGYIGVAPLADGVTNVCVVRELHARRAALPPADALVDLALAADPMLRARFARARRVAPVTVLGPLAVKATSAGVAGLLLAGDAAGFIDPMTGDGLRFAIRGAELAAEHACAELQTGRPMHAPLAVARRREFGSKWRMNAVLRTVVGSPPAVHVSAAIARAWHAPVRMLINKAADIDRSDSDSDASDQ